jgi:hypothetical protein
MVTINQGVRNQFEGPSSMSAVCRLAMHVCYEFDLQTVLAREKSMRKSGHEEIYFPMTTRSKESVAIRQPPSAEDIRLHAWLDYRLAVLRYQRHGLWPKLRRFLLRIRLTRLWKTK